jgi:hypothetical protein
MNNYFFFCSVILVLIVLWPLVFNHPSLGNENNCQVWDLPSCKILTNIILSHLSSKLLILLQGVPSMAPKYLLASCSLVLLSAKAKTFYFWPQKSLLMLERLGKSNHIAQSGV